MAFGPVVDDETVAEFLGQADGGGDVVGTVAVLIPGELAVEDVGQGLLDQVTVERGALGFRLGSFGPVVPCLDEGVADDLDGAHPRRRGDLLLPVHAFRVLAERGFHGQILRHEHLVDDPSPGLEEGGATADGVAGSGLDERRGDSPTQRILESEIGRVDAVERAQARPIGIGHLIRIVTGPAFAVLMHAEVAVGFDETGQDPASASIDDLGVRWEGRGVDSSGGHLGDAAVPDGQRARFDRLGAVAGRIGHGHDPRIRDDEICGCGDRN